MGEYRRRKKEVTKFRKQIRERKKKEKAVTMRQCDKSY